MRGDPYFDMDARIAKNIKLGEHRNLQLMFQAFNLYQPCELWQQFRHTRLSLQKGLSVSTFWNPVGFINPTSSTLPRAFTAEFGARFSF